MRVDKPYIENPDSKDRDMIELALESWSNALSRDWSFAFFMFYGQIKSTLQCLNCQKESTTFSVFNNIMVNMPEPTLLMLNIVVHRLPSSLKGIISPVDKRQNMDVTMT